jgi:hypothetical protein
MSCSSIHVQASGPHPSGASNYPMSVKLKAFIAAHVSDQVLGRHSWRIRGVVRRSVIISVSDRIDDHVWTKVKQL